MDGKCFCPLGEAAIAPVISSISKWRDEYLAHTAHGGCPMRREP